MQKVNWRTVSLIALETGLIVSAIALASYVRLSDEAWAQLTPGKALLKAMFIALVCQLCLYYSNGYELRGNPDQVQLLFRVVQALGATSFVLAVAYFWFPSLIIGRGVFIIAATLAASFIFGWRVAFAWWTRRVSPRERLLLVGTGQAAIALARELYDRRQELGVEIVGFIDPDPEKVGRPVINPGIVGTIDDIPAIVSTRCVDRVVVSLGDARGKLPMDKLLDIRLANGVTFDYLASVYEEYTGKIALENLRPSWLIFSPGFRKTRLLRGSKRVIDVVVAAVGLLLAAPIMLIVAVLLKLTSPGPVFYLQQRVGLHGRLFTLYKFRTMKRDAEADTGAVWASPNDSRITTVGRLLRPSRLDELPQLWSVLIGDMSLVGPRPERPEFVEQLIAQIPFYGQRHVVKPGVSGWAQVNFMYGASVEDAMEKLQYDLFYIKNMSIALDLFVLAKTTKTVLLAQGT